MPPARRASGRRPSLPSPDLPPQDPRTRRVSDRRSPPTSPKLPPQNAQAHRVGARRSSPPPRNPFESQLRRVGARRRSPPPSPRPPPARPRAPPSPPPAHPRAPPSPPPPARRRASSPRIGSGRCRIDMSKVHDYYDDIEAMRTNVATVNAPPTPDDPDYARNVQYWKRFRVFFEEYLKLAFQLRRDQLKKSVREAAKKQRAQAMISQRADTDATPSPRRSGERGRNGLNAPYTFDAETLSRIGVPQHTAEQFSYDPTLNRLRQIQSQENPFAPPTYPSYSHMSSDGTQVSKSRDISPPAHLLPSDLFSDSPPPPTVVTYEDLCQTLEQVDDSAIKKACEIITLATNIKNFAEHYKAIEPANDEPLQEMSPIFVQEDESTNEKHNEELPFKLLNEIFESAETTQHYQTQENQYFAPLTLNLESNQYCAQDNILEVNPLSLESSQYNIRDSYVQRNTYTPPNTPSLHLDRNFAITREPFYTPLQETPRPQSNFASLNIDVTSAQADRTQEHTPYQYSSLTYTSAQLLPYEIFCKDFATQPNPNDIIEHEQSRFLESTASYFPHDIDYVDQNQFHAELPQNNKPDENLMKDTHGIDESLKQRKWSLLPYWVSDGKFYETKATVDPADQISFKEIEEEINALTISDETIEIPEYQLDPTEEIDWAEISPIWSYKKEEKTIGNENTQSVEPNELLTPPCGEKELNLDILNKEDSIKSGSQHEPENEFQFLLMPTDRVKDSKEKSVLSPDVLEHVESKECSSQNNLRKNKGFEQMTSDTKDKTVPQPSPRKKEYQPTKKVTVKSCEKDIYTNPNRSKITIDPIKIKPNKNNIKAADTEETDNKPPLKKQAGKPCKNRNAKASKYDKKPLNQDVTPNKPDDKVEPEEKTSRKPKVEVIVKGRRKSKHMKNTKGRKSKKK